MTLNHTFSYLSLRTTCLHEVGHCMRVYMCVCVCVCVCVSVNVCYVGQEERGDRKKEERKRHPVLAMDTLYWVKFTKRSNYRVSIC